MKNWTLYFDDGMIGGELKRFWFFSSAIKYAIKNIERADWIYIDNNNLPIKRIYLKTPKNHWTEDRVILEIINKRLESPSQ